MAAPVLTSQQTHYQQLDQVFGTGADGVELHYRIEVEINRRNPNLCTLTVYRTDEEGRMQVPPEALSRSLICNKGSAVALIGLVRRYCRRGNKLACQFTAGAASEENALELARLLMEEMKLGSCQPPPLH